MTERPRNGDPADVPLDADLARAYHDAAREEPPQHLDAAILAAARREAHAQPRALQAEKGGESVPIDAPAHHAPADGRRWHVPLAIAAVVVLSVTTVTLQREEEAVPRPAPPSEPAAVPGLRDAPPRPQAPARKPAPPEQSDEARAAVPSEQSPRTEAKARQDAAPASAASKVEELGNQRRVFGAPQVPGARPMVTERESPSELAAEKAPEKWGERIVELRRLGKAGEADALLAEFRRRFPGHAIPDEWLH